MSALRFIGISALILAALALVNFYVHRRASQTFELGRRGKLALAVMQALGLVGMATARAAERQLGIDAARVLGLTAGVFELGLLIACGLLLLVDLARSVGKLVRMARDARRRRAANRDGSARDAERDATRSPRIVDDARSLRVVDDARTPLADDSALAPLAEDSAHAPLSDQSALAPLSDESARTPLSAHAPLSDQSAPAPLTVDRAPVTSELPRREFLTRIATGSALALGGGTALYGALIGRRDYRIDTVPVRIVGLPRTLDGFTIAQISDIHFGVYARTDEVNIAASLIARARPDLVVITGDMIDHDDAFAPYLGQLIARVRGAARHGVAVIPGNHDHYAGVERVLATARSAGARVLLNEGRVIGDAGGGFALLGVDDVWMRRESGGPDLSRAIAMVPRDLPRILLCHNPAFFPESAAHIALQLSGHTHGGQVNVGPRLADYVLPFGYVAGLYERGDAQLYVNRGFGTAGPPSRVGSPPEITRIVLVAA